MFVEKLSNDAEGSFHSVLLIRDGSLSVSGTLHIKQKNPTLFTRNFQLQENACAEKQQEW